jgi:hypothetical protein
MNRHERRKRAKIAVMGPVVVMDRAINYSDFEQLCTTCGNLEDCRPYGVNDAWICYDCMMATPESRAVAAAKFKELTDNKEDMH